MPIMFGSSGLSTQDCSYISMFDSAFFDMQNKMKFIASIPNLSPPHQEVYLSLTNQFRSFERAYNMTDVNASNCAKIYRCGHLNGIKSRIDNLYNLLSTSIVSNPVVTTATTTPVPPKGSGSLSADSNDLLASLRSMGIL